MICDDLSARVSAWMEQIDAYLSESSLYDESVRDHLTKVRDAMEELRAHIEMEEMRDFLDSM